MDQGTYLGRSIAFPPRIGPDGRWAWSEGSDNVRESIEVILLTEANERVMLDAFGGGLRKFLYEPNTASTRRLMQERITEALRLWEPRINVQSVTVDPDPEDQQAAIATVQYRLVATQSTGQMSLSISLAG